MSIDVKQINEKVQQEAAQLQQVRQEIGKVIVGQQSMVERLLAALISGSHVLLEGVPGLAKTLTITTLAQAVQASFHRIQFTPDLLPADVIGTLVYNPKSGDFTTRRGPIFANIILADEINRAPAKVQSALLEAMQEKQITIGDSSYALPQPFMVLATQNPVEQEGTYPLPEAQLDRFIYKLKVDYPSTDEELQILRRMAGSQPQAAVSPVITPDDLLRMRSLCSEIFMDARLEEYIIAIVDCTRNPEKYGLENLKPLIRYGASPRATLGLAQASKAQAMLSGRGYTTPQDIKEIAFDILRHRVALTYEAEAEETSSEQIIQKVLDSIPVP